MTRDTALTAKEIDRLTAVLAKFKNANNYPNVDERVEALRCLVLWPDIENWNALHRTALDARQKLSLWAATCLVSSYPAVVAIDQNNLRYWSSAPPADALLRALEYAFA